MQYFDSTVIRNDQIMEDIFVLVVERKGASAKAGQFYMLKCWDNELTLMRPISIFKAEKDTLYFMYRVIGKGTRKFSGLKPGEKISLMGALGNGYPDKEMLNLKSNRIALLGGGLGIPPLCETAKEYKAMGYEVDVFLGYRDELFSLEDFEPYCDNIFVSTEKGEEGYKGFITDLLKPEEYGAVFTCGPEIMMRKVAALCAEASVPCWCSMEHRMACGIGACLGCSIKTTQGMKRVCKDGPIFLSIEIF